MSAQLEAEALGKFGAVVRTTTSPATGKFVAIECLADTVLASLTSNINGDSLVGVTLASGTIIRGHITAFTLTSGKVVAYNTFA